MKNVRLLRDRIVWICLWALFLNSCVLREDIAAEVAGTSDEGVCRGWMRMTENNFLEKYYKFEIDKRGLDCEVFGDVFASKVRADKRYSKPMRAIRYRFEMLASRVRTLL
jgi:hypothetical protein